MAGSDACGDITELLVEWSRGSQVALDRLMPIV